MNSVKFYSDEDLEYIQKKELISITFLIFVSLIFIACITLFFVFSTYDTKTYYAIGSVLVSVISCFLVVFLSYKIADLKHIKRHFLSISVLEESKVKITFISMGEKPITIDRFTKVYQIEAKIGDKIKNIYLNALYSYQFINNHEYEVILTSDYIKEICNEL